MQGACRAHVRGADGARPSLGARRGAGGLQRSLDYGSGDLEDGFFALYAQVQEQLQRILATRSQVAVMTGEGMLGLWAGLKRLNAPAAWTWPSSSGPSYENSPAPFARAACRRSADTLGSRA